MDGAGVAPARSARASSDRLICSMSTCGARGSTSGASASAAADEPAPLAPAASGVPETGRRRLEEEGGKAAGTAEEDARGVREVMVAPGAALGAAKGR